MKRGRNVFCLVLLLGCFFGRVPSASGLQIGEAEGAVYDGIFDGYPGVALFDGTPDLLNNPPSVALKFGVLEMRTIAEFPLAPWVQAGEPPIRRILLHFNIDDVIPTFGPGAEFSGRAADQILVHLYCGDGTIELADFQRIAATPYVVDTTSFGPITDASLARTGPLRFEVDVTSTAQALLATGCPWLGFVFRTLSNNTATSIDDLGDGGSYGGTKGSNGATMPYLTVEVAPIAPTATLTPTATATATERPHETPTSTPDPSPLPTGSASPATPARGCAGDCDGDGAVTVDEILTLVRVALDLGLLDACPAGDRDGNGIITVDEIVAAVSAALLDCG